MIFLPKLKAISHNIIIREVYATILHSSKDYVCGALALAQCLPKTGTKHDLILLLDKNISAPKLWGPYWFGVLDPRKICIMSTTIASLDHGNSWTMTRLFLLTRTLLSCVTLIFSFVCPRCRLQISSDWSRFNIIFNLLILDHTSYDLSSLNKLFT